VSGIVTTDGREEILRDERVAGVITAARHDDINVSTTLLHADGGFHVIDSNG
jgi:hypothetical protein